MLHYRKYTQLNDAPWVVFVHGAGGSSSLWFKQIREFRHYFNIILVDLRGHGKSNLFLEGIYKEQFTLREATEDIIEVLDTENIHQAHFIGMSLGSVIIRELAEIAPERISSIILGGAVTKFNIRSQLLLKMVYFLKRIIPFMWLYKCLAFAVMPRKRNRESRLIFINDAKKISRSEYLRWFHLISEANPLLCSLNAIKLKCPALYIMGEQDYLFLPAVKKILSVNTDAKLEIIKNVGHVCNVEAPEDFNKISINFIIKIEDNIKRINELC